MYCPLRTSLGRSLGSCLLRSFFFSKYDLVAPHLHGKSPQTAGSANKYRQWTEREFFDAIEESQSSEVKQVIKDLYDWSRASADRIWFGTGKNTGSFSFQLKGRILFTVFSIYTSTTMTLSYGTIRNQVSPETMEAFHTSIHEIPPFRDVVPDSKYPSMKVSDTFVGQPESLQKSSKSK
jgi:hypothetical protein